MAKTKTYKAQWPLSTVNSDPQILIYEVNKNGDCKPNTAWIEFPATKEYRDSVFGNKLIRVFFRGVIEGETLRVIEFIWPDKWL